MNRYRKNNRGGMIAILLFLLISLLGFPAKIAAQSHAVSGQITTSTGPVQYAEVIFIDNSDTTKQVSALTDASGHYQLDVLTSIASNGNQPKSFALGQNYPNPFSTSTAISYQLIKPSNVQVTIYDILGREVRRFSLGVQANGTHGIRWDGRDQLGEKIAPGIYFYRLQAGNETQVRKMIFGTGERHFIGARPGTFVPPVPQAKDQIAKLLQQNRFTVRIENTDSTSPPITPIQFSNVQVSNDTTLNFAVPLAVVVHIDSTRQVIQGFGAANIRPWRSDMTVDEINKAFGTGPGQIGFTILRLRVPYSENEFGLNVPTAQMAAAMGVKIIASPWTPPAAMKTNNNIVGGRLRDDSYEAYAAHLKSFADSMASNGVPLYAISVQNEPDVSVTYESCDWNAAEMVRFLRENAPSIGIPVFAPESFNFNKTISDAILNDSVAAANTAFIGGHIYGGGLEPYPLAESKGKEIWMTEHLELTTDWAGALATGKEIHDCMVAGMSAYIWWYIVRFYGPIYDDDNRRPPGTEKGEVSQRGYVMSQYARFVRPGYLRVSATEHPRRDVFVTAYSGDDRVVIVALNTGPRSADQTFVVPNAAIRSFTPYVTSGSKNSVQEGDLNVSNGRFTTSLEPASITTFVSD